MSSGRRTSPNLKVIGWGWYYASTVLDDYSRYIVAWQLCPSMKVPDVEQTVQKALKACGPTKGPGSCRITAPVTLPLA